MSFVDTALATRYKRAEKLFTELRKHQALISPTVSVLSNLASYMVTWLSNGKRRKGKAGKKP
uniref:Uncharacterized protein n=1 Tax=Echinococcus canadensis TaxID=519352 RepID=A0A915EX93_9CEST